MQFILNQDLITIDTPASLTLLDYLRQQTCLRATKSACHQGECGSCLILFGRLQDNKIHYQAVNACLLALGELQGKHVVTLEGLNQENPNPLQQAFVDCAAVQCGYCTSGFIIALTEFFLNTPSYTLEAAKLAISNNICRCTGYQAIKRAILQLVKTAQPGNLHQLHAQGFIPDYFLTIAERLIPLHNTPPTLNDQQPAIGGGTDFFLQAHSKQQSLEFLSEQPALSGISLTDDACTIGAETSIETIRCSPIIKQLLPSLEHDLSLFAAKPLRQRATVAGNLVNASPIADMAVILLSLNAELELENAQHNHSLALKDFFLSYKQIAKQTDELIKRIKIPLPLGLFHYQKVAKRTYLDIASVNSAIHIHLNNNIIQTVHLAIGGVAATPLYLGNACSFLQGKALNTSTLKTFFSLVQSEITPISDIHGSQDYKRLLTRQILISHFIALFPKRFTGKAFL